MFRLWPAARLLTATLAGSAAVSAGTVLPGGPAAPAAHASGDAFPVAQASAPRSRDTPYDSYMRLGYAASRRGNHAAAATYFRDALFYVPGDREATIAYWNERRALRRSATPSDRTPSESAYDRAMRLGYDETHARDYQSALINFRRALAQRPGDYYATQAIRNVRAYLAGARGEALPSVEQVRLDVATGHYPGESAYDRYMRLGYAASKERRYGKAADYFRSALHERPNDRMATIAFWNQKHNLNRSSGVAARPRSPGYERLMRLGYDAMQRHHFATALRYFQAALEVNPGDRYAQQAVRNVRAYVSP